MKYTVDYFIEKFKRIPIVKWYSGDFQNPKDSYARCALGHCGVDNGMDWELVEEASDLEQLFMENLEMSVMSINDMKIMAFNQDTPKERVLAALERIKRKTTPIQEIGKVKERIVYVVVPEVVKVEAKQLLALVN